MSRNPNPSHRRIILPGLQVPSVEDPELQKFLQAVKEHIEVYIGSKGQPGERFVTLQDLKNSGLADYVVKRGRGEIGNTAATATAPARGATTSQIAGLSDADVQGRRDGDVLRYIASKGKWQRYAFFDVDGVALEAAVPKTYESAITFRGGITVGDLTFGSTEELRDALGVSGGGGALVYVNTSIPAENTVANSDSETAFASSYTIPADTLAQGSILRLRLAGSYSTDASVAPTIRLRVKLDGNTVLDSDSIALSTGASDAGWWADVQLVLHSIGVAGELDAQGVMSVDGDVVHLVTSSLATVDTTGELPVTVTVQWGAADADDTITLREMAVYLDSATAAQAAAAPAAASFVTTSDETAALPNSVVLVAGDNISFDTSTPGQLEISASGSGGGGTLDHGALEGLEDDDHPQYLLRSILTTSGDLLVQGEESAARLAKGTDGQVLTMVSGSPAWADASGSGGGAEFNPLTTLDYFYDFLVGGISSTEVEGWDGTWSGNSTLSCFGEAGHPGIIRMTLGSSGGAGIGLGFSINSLAGLVLSSDVLTIEWLTRLPTVPDSTNNFYTQFGLTDNGSSPATNRILFGARYDPDGSGQLKWTSWVSSGGVLSQQYADSGPTANAWHLLKIEATSTEVNFYVDGALVFTETSNIPSVDMGLFGRIGRTTGTATRYFDIDYVRMRQTFSARNT